MYVLLQGENSIMLNTGDRVVPHRHHGATESAAQAQHKLFSNKAWMVVQVRPNTSLKLIVSSSFALFISFFKTPQGLGTFSVILFFVLFSVIFFLSFFIDFLL